jgi:soluble lytic murein transglycosylase-like protein
MPLDAKLVQLAQRAAEAEGLDPALVCAVVDQESGWNPWATEKMKRLKNSFDTVSYN